MESRQLAHDLREGARLMGIGLTKFRQESDAGRVRTFRVGRRRLVSEQALADYVAFLEDESTTLDSGGKEI